jgi:hypothetical protein
MIRSNTAPGLSIKLTCSGLVFRVFLSDLVESNAVVQLLQGLFLFGMLLAQNVANIYGLGSFLSTALLVCAFICGLAFVTAFAFRCHSDVRVCEVSCADVNWSRC